MPTKRKNAEIRRHPIITRCVQEGLPYVTCAELAGLRLAEVSDYYRGVKDVPPTHVAPIQLAIASWIKRQEQGDAD